MPREYYNIPLTKDTQVLLSALNRILVSISRRLNYIYADGDNVGLDGKKLILQIIHFLAKNIILLVATKSRKL